MIAAASRQLPLPFPEWTRPLRGQPQRREPLRPALPPRGIPHFPQTTLDYLMGFQGADARVGLSENPFGPSPKAVAAIAAGLSQVNRYALSAPQLQRAVADFHGVPESMVILGVGSTELLELVPQAYLAEGGSLVTMRETYQTTPALAEKLGAPVHQVPHRPDWSFDVQGLLDAVRPDTTVLYLVNPDNPTGSVLGYEALRTLAEQLPPHVLLFVDEAYAEFLPEKKNAIDLIKEGYSNVFVTRTFSKGHGLAGLRIGYGIGTPETIARLNAMKRNKPHLHLNVAGIWGAMAALEDQEHLARYVAHAKEARAFYERALGDLGVKFVSGVGPFIAVKTPGDSTAMVRELAARKIFVKDGKDLGMPGYIRISYGLERENRKVAAALKSVLTNPPLS